MDIYAAIDVSGFQLTTRCSPFDWRLLHGLDVDELVRSNATAKLEAVIPALQQGSIDAEHALSHHNCVQLFRLVQLAVEHLWQMRESHAKLYPAYLAAVDAADCWKAAAAAYLDVGGRLLAQLHSEQGALLTEELLAEAAVAREAVERADSGYNAALDVLEAEDAAARRHTLRRQRLDISWRLVFGLDVQHLAITGDVSQLEQLLPQVAYGNVMAESPAALTAAHFRQLLLLGQACVDYLYTICQATSKAIQLQVQQLASASTPIPELTTACEELRVALAAALGGSIRVLQAAVVAPSPAKASHAAIRATATATGAASPLSTAGRSGSPTCHHVAHLCATSSNSTQGAPCCGAAADAGCCCHHTHSRQPGCGHCCCGVSRGVQRLGNTGLAPTADRLQLRIEQLDRDLRHEWDRTHGMRQALEEMSEILQQLPSHHQQRPAAQHSPKQHRQQQQQQQQQHSQLRVPPHTVNVPVTISLADREGGRRAGESLPASPASVCPDSPNGAVRVLINEDTIRARERSAAGQQLCSHINDIILGHQLTQHGSSHGRRGGTSPGSSRTLLSFKAVPSPAGAASRSMQAFHTSGCSMSGAAMGGTHSAAFMSGPARGWWQQQQQQQQHALGVVFADAQANDGLAAAHPDGAMLWSTGQGPAFFVESGAAARPLPPAAAVGATEAGQQQQQQQQQWPLDPQAAAGVVLHAPRASAGTARALQSPDQPQDAGGAGPRADSQDGDSAALRAAAASQVAALRAAGIVPAADGTPSGGDGSADPSKRQQQELFREAAAGGFRRLLRSVSPKRMFASPVATKAGAQAGSGTGSPGPASVRGAGGAGALVWPGGGGSGTQGRGDSSLETSPARSGRSFTARAAARAAEELVAAAALQPRTPAEAFSPLKASILAHAP